MELAKLPPESKLRSNLITLLLVKNLNSSIKNNLSDEVCKVANLSYICCIVIMYNLSFLLLFLYITLKRVKCQENNVKKGDIKVSKINNLFIN